MINLNFEAVILLINLWVEFFYALIYICLCSDYRLSEGAIFCLVIIFIFKKLFLTLVYQNNLELPNKY